MKRAIKIEEEVIVKSPKLLFVCLAVLFVAWAVMAALGVCGQRKLFVNEGREVLSDYWMPRMCLEQGYVGHPESLEGLKACDTGDDIQFDERGAVRSTWYTDGTNRRYVTSWIDKVYPRFGILPLMPFPTTFIGGWIWTGLAGLVFLLSLCLVAKSWWPLMLGLTAPFLFNVERGNTTWLSAALVGIFLAWWDDEMDWKCMVAAVSLAAAGAMKISPFALGMLYFAKWRWKPVVVCCLASLAFLILPWLCSSEGMSGFAAMLYNASRHGTTFLRASDFGVIPVWRAVRILMGLDVMETWPGAVIVARLTQVFGLASMVISVRRRDILLLASGMILAAGNMYYYAALYLFPVLALEISRLGTLKPVESVLWFVLLCPLQIVFHGCAANQIFGNLAIMGMMAIHLVECVSHIGNKECSRVLREDME